MKSKKEIGFIKRLVPSNYKLLLYALLVGLVTGLLSPLFRMILARLVTLRTISEIVGLHQFGLDWLWSIFFTVIGVCMVFDFLVKKYASETAGS
ncbi:hypothetical protein [Maribacter aquivivus]|uniref:hypothetical protein n=1 Tax=Maribacter aquivivus TaxID=228958 RepID=UPI0024928CC6|nr:hypothetical protein [Maribacter aquivivus]